MDDIIEVLENIATYFNNINNEHFYLKQQITDFNKTNKIKLDFKYCHIALSKNGGLIAICKKKGFLDTSRNSKLNNYIIVMFQNAGTIYEIKIDWNYSKRWIVCLDFTVKQELFGILNDGGILKIKYIDRVVKEIPTSETLREEGIQNAKFFKNGFIAYTTKENFYYCKNIKNPEIIFICDTGMIGSSPNMDFLAISNENSKSKRLELLITNENGNGVFLIEQQPEGQKFKLNIVNENRAEVLGVNLILKGYLEPFLLSSNTTEKSESDYPKGFGKIAAIAISPSGSNVAFYNSINRVAFIMNSKFEGKYSKVFFNFDENEINDEQKNEIKAILEFKQSTQFLFCGEDSLAIVGQRFVLISRANANNALAYLIKEGSEFLAMQGIPFSKCASEVDGLRCLTNEGVFLILNVSKELCDVCYPFSEDKSKDLIKIYKSTLSSKYNSHKDIKAIAKLEEIVVNVQKASADIFWTEKENEEKQYKEVQLFLLKAAQYGKLFVNKGYFNYEKFNIRCKNMRIINQLRNDEKYPIFITYREFIRLEYTDIIDTLIQYKNFKSAAQISKFLGYDIKKLMYKFMIEKMKYKIKIADMNRYSSDKKEEFSEENIYQELLNDIEKLPDISYVKLAKKAIKFGSEKLAMKLLDQEKSALTKIPQLIELNKLSNSLNICFETFNFNILSIVLNKISENSSENMSENEKVFFDNLCRPELQKHHSKIILFFKKYKPEKLEYFLLKTKNYNEFLYMKLNKLYKSQKSDEKMSIIKEIKEEIKNYDPKYKKYIETLENSIKFKKKCIEENIIYYSEILPYSKTVYDCYLTGNKKDKYNWIEGQNKNLEYSPKKLNIIRFRALLDIKRPDLIDSQLEKTSLKKLGLTPMNMGEIYYDYKMYDKATEYLMQVKDSQYSEYVIELLKSMNKHAEALEVVISDKIIDPKERYIDEIIQKDPNLKNYVNELCVKYKVNLTQTY